MTKFKITLTDNTDPYNVEISYAMATNQTDLENYVTAELVGQSRYTLLEVTPV